MEIALEKEMFLSLCICGKCPTWIDCNGEKGYCYQTIGKSSCITKEKGCICGGCPVTKKMKFRYLYYCTKGSEKEQSS